MVATMGQQSRVLMRESGGEKNSSRLTGLEAQRVFFTVAESA